MVYLNAHSDALCAEDINTLRSVFDRFCEIHQKSRSDLDMEICANLMVRLYQSGEREPEALTKACEAALKQDFALSA